MACGISGGVYRALVAGVVLAGGPALGWAADPPHYGSDAALTKIALDVNGQRVALPLDRSEGKGAPSYDVRHPFVGSPQTISLPTAPGAKPLQLVVSIPSGSTSAHGRRLAEGAGYEAVGKASAHAVKVALQTAEAAPVDLLVIKATRLRTEATANTTAAGKQTEAGDTKVGVLTFSGRLLGGQTVKLTGTLKPTTVFSSPLIEIIVDKQSHTTAGSEKKLTVDGVDVVLLGGKISGSPISGHVKLAIAGAY